MKKSDCDHKYIVPVTVFDNTGTFSDQYIKCNLCGKKLTGNETNGITTRYIGKNCIGIKLNKGG